MLAAAAAARAAAPGMHRANTWSPGDPVPWARVDGLHRWLAAQNLVCNPWLYTRVWANGHLYVSVYWFPAVPAETPLLRPWKWHTTLAIADPAAGFPFPAGGGLPRRIRNALRVIRRCWQWWRHRLLPAPGAPGRRQLRLRLPEGPWSWNFGLRGVERRACRSLHRLAVRLLTRAGLEVRIPVGGLHISWNV